MKFSIVLPILALFTVTNEAQIINKPKNQVGKGGRSAFKRLAGVAASSHPNVLNANQQSAPVVARAYDLFIRGFKKPKGIIKHISAGTQAAAGQYLAARSNDLSTRKLKLTKGVKNIAAGAQGAAGQYLAARAYDLFTRGFKKPKGIKHTSTGGQAAEGQYLSARGFGLKRGSKKDHSGLNLGSLASSASQAFANSGVPSA